MPEPGPIPRKNGKPPKVRDHRKALKPESDQHYEQRIEEDAWRPYYRGLFKAIELHEIARRSKDKRATAYPENCLPCPTRAYHEMVQHESMERQTARRWLLDRQVIVMIYGKPIAVEDIITALRDLLDDERDGVYFQ